MEGAKTRAKRVMKPSFDDYSRPAYEVLEDFLEQREIEGLVPSTLKNYRQSVTYFFEFLKFDEDSSINLVTKDEIYHFINSKRIDGAKYTSINHYLRDIKTFLYWCMEQGYIEKFTVELVKGQEEQLKLFTEDEVEILIEKPKRSDGFSDWRMWVIINWILDTGNRASTICNLKWGDIDFRHKEYILRHTKSKRAKSLPISDETIKILKFYQRTMFKDATKDDWLFPRIDRTEPLNPNSLGQAFTRYCKKRGVTHSNIHGLRHTFAKMYCDIPGNKIEKLQEILDHSSIETTRKYVTLFAEDVKKGYNEQSPLVKLAKKKNRTNVMNKSREW